MTNFSKIRIDCSSIGLIMSDGNKKTAKQNWESACNELAVQQQTYDNLEERRKKMAGGIKNLQRIEDLKAEIVELETRKDDECLSEGAKSHLNNVYAECKYHKKALSTEMGNKFSVKGRLIEDLSIDMICKLDNKQVSKNKTKLMNDYLQGIPDIIEGDNHWEAEYVTDVKSPWDIGSFFDNLGKPLNKLYWWQMQGYFALTDAGKGEVSFCLVNTPDSLIENEISKWRGKLQPSDFGEYEFMSFANDLRNSLTYDDIPLHERRLRFIVERDDASIERIYRKVKACREYLTEIENQHIYG